MQKYLWKPVKKTLKWKGLCKNSWAYRWCHVPTILWALRLPPQEWLCSPPLASPGPPLGCSLLASLSAQSPGVLEFSSADPSTLSATGSKICTPLARTCLHLRSDFSSASSREVYYIRFELGISVFLGRMAYCFHFHFLVEKTEPGSDFFFRCPTQNNQCWWGLGSCILVPNIIAF